MIPHLYRQFPIPQNEQMTMTSIIQTASCGHSSMLASVVTSLRATTPDQHLDYMDYAATHYKGCSIQAGLQSPSNDVPLHRTRLLF